MTGFFCCRYTIGGQNVWVFLESICVFLQPFFIPNSTR
jgi:hypothetical protein